MLTRKHIRKLFLAGTAGALAFLGSATPASAGTGCNGVWNIFVWGCAPWDNNNGPQYPYYRKRQVTVRADHVVMQNGAPMAQVNGQYYPLIGHDGSSLIGHDGASVQVWVQN